MPENFSISQYRCKLCGCIYNTLAEAESCESRPISEDKGVKVGDIVLITSGEGKGEFAKVTSTGVFDKYYGHYYWERMWHTVFVSVKLIDSWGSRTLAFDSYIPMKDNHGALDR